MINIAICDDEAKELEKAKACLQAIKSSIPSMR